jgi:hypothetical protein
MQQIDINCAALNGTILLAAAFHNGVLHSFSPGLRFTAPRCDLTCVRRAAGKPGLWRTSAPANLQPGQGELQLYRQVIHLSTMKFIHV